MAAVSTYLVYICTREGSRSSSSKECGEGRHMTETTSGVVRSAKQKTAGDFSTTRSTRRGTSDVYLDNNENSVQN